MRKNIRGFVIFLALLVLLSGIAYSASVYITPKPAGPNDDLVCHVSGGCAGYHIIRWYRNSDLHSETITNGAFSVDSSQTAEGETWECKAYDYCTNNPIGDDSVSIQISNYPPQISPNLPDRNLSENSGFHDDLTDIWAYVTDESPDNELYYTIVEETDTSVVDCAIDNNRFVDCTVQPDMVGYSDVRVRVTDPEGLSSEDVFRVHVHPVNQLPNITLVSPVQGSSYENCDSIWFYVDTTDYDGTIQDITWYVDGTELLGRNNFTIIASDFGAGDHTGSVVVSDNLGGTASISLDFTVQEHTNPTCMITGPVNNPDPAAVYSFLFGEMLNFSSTASATDSCQPSFHYMWRDNDEPIVNDQQNFSRDNLTLGRHNMTLYVTDGHGGECYDTMNINITQDLESPTANITSPAEGSSFVSECERIFFNVTAEDTDGIINSIFWYWGSSQISTSQSFFMNASDFDMGDNTVSVDVVDDDNLHGSDSVTFNVVEHTNPYVNITSPVMYPEDGVYYNFSENAMLLFNATATPTDPCVVSEFNYFWRLDGTPIVSDDRAFSLDNISVGLHNMTVYATDSYNGEAYDSMLLNITEEPNEPPVIDSINCYNEFGGTLLSEHDPIICNASAYDPDGYINIWQWFIDGVLGPEYGAELEVPSPYLDAGNYTVILTVIDNESAAVTNSTSITVVPNQPPEVNITLPSADPYQNMEYCSIDFSAIADDADGYIVPEWDPAYNWRVSMANGTSLDLTTEQNFTYSDMLPPGISTFTVGVTDDDGAQASDSLAVNTTENDDPVVNITMPPFDNHTVIYNRTLGTASIDLDAEVVDGYQNDCDDCNISDYSWTWYDRFKGTTTRISSQKSFTYEDVEDGIHTITVESEDCYGAGGMDTIVVNVTEMPNQNPVVTIHSPNEGENFVNVCSIIPFNATADDPDGDDISSWMWNYEGNTISNLPYFEMDASSFNLGNNTVRAYAFDNQTPAGTGSSAVSFNVADHTGPDVSVSAEDVMLGTAISNGSSVNESRPILFTGSALPTDMCNADDFAYEWEDFFGTTTTTLSTSQNFTTDSFEVGLHRIRLTATDQYNYRGRAYIIINITDVPNRQPVVNFTCYDADTGSTTLTEYEDIVCNATVTDPDGHNITSYLWDVDGDGVAPEGDDESYTLPALLGNGTYNVSLTVTDDGEPIASSTAVREIVVENNAPQVTLFSQPDPAEGLEPESVQFNCSIAAGTGNADFVYNMSYGGDYGDDVTSAVSNTYMTFSQNYDEDGTYNATCYVRDMDGDVGADSIIVTVLDSPLIANFTYIPQAPVENDTINFTDASESYDTITSWEWDFDNDGTEDATTQNATHRFIQDGTYPVTLTVEDINGETDSYTEDVVVADTVPANLQIAAPNQTVEGTNVTLSGFATAYDMPLSYSWDFDVSDGIGVDAEGQTVSNLFVQDGNYTVTLTVTDNDGDSTQLTHVIEVLDTIPVAEAGPAEIWVDEDIGVFFNGSNSTAYDQPPNCGTPMQYFWEFGDGGTSALAEDTHIYPTQGDYVANLTVTDCDGSQDSDTITVHVADSVPVAEAGVSQIVDEGETVTFDGSGSTPSTDAPNNYTWYFGDGENDTGISVTHQYNTTGPQTIFTAILVVNDTDGSANTDNVDIFVNDIHPQVSAGADVTIDEGETVDFSGSGTSLYPSFDPITWFDWDFGDGNTQNGPNPSNQYLDNGTYKVNLTVTDEDSSRSDTLIVTSNNMPPVPDAHGPYACTITEVTSRQFIGTATDASPVDEAALNDSSFEWDMDYYNDTSNFDVNLTNRTPYFMCSDYPSTGIYTVGLRVTDKDGGWNISTATINVTDDPVNNPPFFNHTMGPLTTVNNTYTEYDTNATDIDGDSITYSTDTSLWDLSIDPSTGMVTFTPEETGLGFTANITACDDSGFPNSCTSEQLVISVVADYADPVANITGDYSSYQEGDMITFDGSDSYDPDGGSIQSWTWYWGDGTTPSAGATPSHDYADNGVFTINLTVTDDEGARNSTTLDISIANADPVQTITSNSPVDEGQDAEITVSVDDNGTNDTHLYSFDWNDDGWDVSNNPSNTFTYTTTQDGTFDVRVRTTDDDSGFDEDTIPFVVNDVAAPDTTSPTVTLESPADGSTDTDGDVTVQYHVTDDIAGTLVCDVYSNTSGTWSVDLGGQNTANDTSNTFDYTGLADGLYAWNVECSDGTNTDRGDNNFTFIVDTSAPNTNPTITGLPDQNYLEGSGLHDNVMDLWNYASDAEDAANAMTYTITSETDTSVVDCFIDSNRWIDCNVLPGMTGTSDVTVQVMDTGGLTDTDIFTVTVSAAPPAPTGQDVINSTIYGTFYPYNFSSNVTTTTVTGSWLYNSTVEGAPVTNITNANLTYAILTNVSPIINCTVIGNSTNPSTMDGGSCVNTYIDPSSITESNTTGSSIRNSQISYSNVTNSDVEDSTISYSDLDNCTVTNSDLDNVEGSSCTITDSTVEDSTVNDSTVKNNSTVTNSSITDNSTVDNSTVDNSSLENTTVTNSTITDSDLSNTTVTNSTIDNSTLEDATVENANITDGVMHSGNIAWNGTETVITNSTNLTDLVNYAPTAVISASTTSGEATLNVDFNASGSSDPNVGGALGDSLSYSWDFDNDGTEDATGVTASHSFSSGTYVVTLTVTDSFGKSDTDSVQIDVSSSSSNGGGGGGGSSSDSSGGGSSTGGALVSKTYNCLEEDVKVAPNDKIVVEYKGENYTFFVKDIISNALVTKLYPIPSRDIQLRADEPKKIDLDWNNKYDFSIEVSDVRANTEATVSCKFIKEEKAEEEEVEEKTLSNIKEGILKIASEVVPKEKASPIVGSVLALAIIVIGLLGYSIYKRRQDYSDEEF